MAVKISYFWVRLTDMISAVINMLLDQTVSTQNSFFFFFLFPWLSLNDSLHALKAKKHANVFHLLGFQILKMFHVYKEHYPTFKRGGEKRT